MMPERGDVAVADLFSDLSLFGVVHGTVSVFEALRGVLHPVITSPRNYVGITDLSGIIKA